MAERIKRSQINPAPYNPRIIDAAAEKRLHSKLQDVGLVVPLTWNRRTGNLVSGHQRLKKLDKSQRYNGKPTTDYLLDVAVVDVDDKTERELNVFLNNPSAMGSWDMELLGQLTTQDVDLAALGFDQTELQFFANAADWERDINEPVRGDIDKINQMRDRGRKAKKHFRDTIDDVEYYIVIVFGGRGERDDFVKGLRLPKDQRYYDGERVKEAMRQYDPD